MYRYLSISLFNTVVLPCCLITFSKAITSLKSKQDLEECSRMMHQPADSYSHTLSSTEEQSVIDVLCLEDNSPFTSLGVWLISSISLDDPWLLNFNLFFVTLASLSLLQLCLISRGQDSDPKVLVSFLPELQIRERQSAFEPSQEDLCDVFVT